MQTNELIRSRRQSLGLSEEEVARVSGIGLAAYSDIEMYSDELYEVVAQRSVKALCRALNLDPLVLLGIRCAFCEEGRPLVEEYNLPRNDLIRYYRNSLRLSAQQLGDRVNYYAIEMEKVEGDSEYIEEWRLRDLKALSAALDLPLQVILQVRCSKCSR